MRVFIDANGLLSYFGEDTDVSALEELLRLVKEKKVEILTTEQLENEFLRNVGERINQTREAIGKQELKLEQKLEIRDEKLSEKVKAKVAATEKLFNANREKRLTKYEAKSKKALGLVVRIFKKSHQVPYTNEILERAKLRHLKGNPPKKNDNSYGDAIHWESILEYAVDDDLVLITHDPDFTEPSQKDRVLNRLLVKEWQSKTTKTLTYQRGLGKFINTFEKKEVIPAATVKKEEMTAPTLYPNGILSMPAYNSVIVNNALSSIQSQLGYLNNADGALGTAGSILASSYPNIENSLFRASQITFPSLSTLAPNTVLLNPDPISRGVYITPTDGTIVSNKENDQEEIKGKERS